MTKFHLHARIPALTLLLAILSPVFITVLPMPAVSAEQRLLADIAGNHCAENGKLEQHGDRNPPADHPRICANSRMSLAPWHACNSRNLEQHHC